MENPAPVPSRSTTTNLSDPPRYWFFISYSHSDLREASRFQRAIESFSVPAPLRGSSSRFANLPKKPAPVFRDRDALASSHDLTAEIRSAIVSSANLLVVCSRAASRSKWVAREVEAFLEIHGPESILCLVVDGEPNSADPALECLPEPLRRESFGRDILAADLRREADGRRQALLKILAGGLGLPYERLAARERRRATRRAATWISASLLVALGFGALALHAARNSRQAEREASRANLTSDYLVSVLLQFLPHESNGIPNSALIPLIDASADPNRLAPLASEPLALLRIRNLLGTAYLQLDQPEKALELYEQNLALAEEKFGPGNLATLESRFNVASACIRTRNLPKAEQLYLQILETMLEDFPDSLGQRISIVNNLGSILGDQSRHREAVDLYERHFDALRKVPPHMDNVLDYKLNYANQLLLLGEAGKAMPIFRDAVDGIPPSHDPRQMKAVQAKHMFANALYRTKSLDEAATIYREIQEPLTSTLGPTHTLTLANAARFSDALYKLGRVDEACLLSSEFFGNPPDPDLLKKISITGDDLPPCP